MGGEVLSIREAWSKCKEFLGLPEIAFLSEPAGLDGQWATFSELGQISPNSWTDAYLAAFAKCGDCRLVTFDRGFARFVQLDVLVL